MPFVWVALIWFFVAGSVCYFFAPSDVPLWLVMSWFLLIWALCLVDFLSMTVSFSKFLALKTDRIWQEPRQLLEAIFWGTLKLVCLGLFGMVLIKGRSIPTVGLLAGFGTLVVVPLVGGFWWSFKEFIHA